MARSLRLVLVFIALSIAAPAGAETSDGALILGVFPRRNATETTQLFTPLAEHLAEKIERRVQLVTSKDFESFWRGVTERRYDVVHYNQYHYIRSANAYQVIAHIEEASKSTIAGAIYVRKDSGIKDLAQLRGRKVLFGGGEDAMISYITNLYLMQQAGLKKGDFNSVFAINPPNSILGVYHRQADAAGAGDGILELPVVRNAINTDELIALAVSEPLLQLPIAVKRSMPAKLRAQIQSTLVGLKGTEAGRQVLKAAVLTGIVKAEDKDYEAHRKIVRAVLGAEALQQR
jgi:phosphonate transport system substrate-binding protein